MSWDDFDSFTDGIGDFFHYLLTSVRSYIAKVTGTAMTNAERQMAATSLRNQQTLNQEEYDRKIDFYERFESPEAQVRQYKEAGLNPMLLAGSGAGAAASGGVGSAGSAPAQSVPMADILGSILGFMTKKKQLDQEKALREYENETHRLQVDNYGAYLAALTAGQEQKNSVFFEAFGVDMQGKEADIKAKEAQANYLNEVAGSEVVRRALMESGIRLNDSVTAINVIQKAVIKAQEKYSDRYFKAIAEISEAQATIEGINASVESKLAENGKEYQYHARVAECADMIFKAGMDLDIWEGEAFKKAVSGEMTKKDWTGAVVSVLKTLIGAGAVVGASALRSSARGIVPPSPWTPQQQYQFYNATGYRFDATL